MKLFEVQTDLKSFKYPVVKIIVCLIVIILSIMRKSIFQFSNTLFNVAIAILCVFLTAVSILCIYISVGEVFHTIANCKNKSRQFSKITPVTIEKITEIVSENDIVEIEVCTNNGTIKIGSSAECEYASSVFEHKLFYISSSEYEMLELFTEALIELFPEGIIPVSAIDGLPLE